MEEYIPRVLVAEDNTVSQKVVLATLKRLGYEGVAVANGLETLEALEREAFDLLLLDCEMPELDGFGAARRIRELESERSAARMPILALTAHSSTDDHEKCLAAGMDDCISKPVQRETLGAVLERWLEGEEELPEDAPVEVAPSKKKLLSETEDPMPASPLDPERLRELRAGDRSGSLVRDLFRLYEDDALSRTAGVLEAFESGDASALERAAHQLQGSSLSVGAAVVAWASRRTEYLAASGNVAAAKPFVSRLQDDLNRALAAMNEAVGSADG